MRNLYRPPPRPDLFYGKKKAHPAKRGSVGWATRERNNDADTGAGYVYVLTGLGGLAGDVIKVGQTRNHPSYRADTIRHADIAKHWSDERAIRARHEADPPQLWACFVPDRKLAKTKMSQALVSGYSEKGGRETDSPMPDLDTILRVMTEVTGQTPARFSLIPPDTDRATVARITD